MPRSSHHSYVASSSCQLPIRDGLTLMVSGRTASASMSAMLWIGASQVIRRWYGLQGGGRLGHAEVGVLEPGLGQRLGDAPVELRIGRRVDRRAGVGALEVDGVDRAGVAQRLEERVVPGGRGVQLEAQERVGGEPLGHRLQARRLAQPERDDEGDRAGLRPSTSASERPAWRSARSAAADSNAQRR